MGELDLQVLGQRARKAVSCEYCFMADRNQDWGHIPRRPQGRPNDVPVVPWVGPRYAKAKPRVAVMMLNPGHAAAPHKLTRRDLGIAFRNGTISYEQYNEGLAPLVPQWGFGAIVRWLKELDLEPDAIAFLNVALCAVAGDA